MRISDALVKNYAYAEPAPNPRYRVVSTVLFIAVTAMVLKLIGLTTGKAVAASLAITFLPITIITVGALAFLYFIFRNKAPS